MRNKVINEIINEQQNAVFLMRNKLLPSLIEVFIIYNQSTGLSTAVFSLLLITSSREQNRIKDFLLEFFISNYNFTSFCITL
jgi:hypothetical protein